ncbi:MAG TPA: thioredoxin domain-containing protein [Nitrosarchaeum sp.]|nr:thioredoxin domain-containing protein [Nitrosarchaeum sp.]
MIHAPSLAIGAGIASVVIVGAFFALGLFNNEPELTVKPTPVVQETGPAKITAATFLENGSPILGDPNAPITMVEFGDYQCYFCNQFFHTTEDELFKKFVDTGKVKVIFKDFTIIGADSVTAAHAAHCADDQGLFWKYHDVLYNNWTGENNGWASSKNLLQFAGDVGLNTDEFSKCMIDSKHTPTIVNSNKDAKDLGLTGTPAFFIIGPDNKVTKIGGAQPFDVFEKIFNSYLEK